MPIAMAGIIHYAGAAYLAAPALLFLGRPAIAPVRTLADERNSLAYSY